EWIHARARRCGPGGAFVAGAPAPGSVGLGFTAALAPAAVGRAIAPLLLPGRGAVGTGRHPGAVDRRVDAGPAIAPLVPERVGHAAPDAGRRRNGRKWAPAAGAAKFARRLLRAVRIDAVTVCSREWV